MNKQLKERGTYYSRTFTFFISFGGISTLHLLSLNLEDYEYILGLPSWFFYSCVLGLVLINTLVYFCVKMFFKDFDLNAIENKRKKMEARNKWIVISY